MEFPITHARLTDYEMMYEDIYWGKFQIHNAMQLPDQFIVNNRNRFINDYSIQSPRKKPSMCELTEDDSRTHKYKLDHREFYWSEEGEKISICSHAEHVVMPPAWRRTYPMYSKDLVTWVKIISLSS
jgi:hypothetical protein